MTHRHSSSSLVAPFIKRGLAVLLVCFISSHVQEINCFPILPSWGGMTKTKSTRQLPTFIVSSPSSNRHASSNENENENDKSNNRDDDDWRAFRARLVMRMQEQERQEQKEKGLSVSPSSSSSSSQAADKTRFATTGSPTSSSSSSSASSATTMSWTYDAGSLVEKGSLVLSRIESKWGCPDLDQPYLGKCVILIIQQPDPSSSGSSSTTSGQKRFDSAGSADDAANSRLITQGIILNRPTDLRLDVDGNVIEKGDDSNVWNSNDADNFGRVILEEFMDTIEKPNDKWRMFFGGEVASPKDAEIVLEGEEDILVFDEEEDDDDVKEASFNMKSDDEDDEEDETIVICLHNISSPAALLVSEEIAPGVYMTSHDDARALVTSGEASHEAFYLFYGCCVWEPNQLQTEIQNGSWYVASTNLQSVVFEELGALRDDSYNVQKAGLEMWERFIHKLGKQEEVARDLDARGSGDGSDDFSDLMLKEWITQNLVSDPKNAGGSGGGSTLDDRLIYRALQAAGRPPVQGGSLLRASSQMESPFVLENQYLYKAIVLMLQDSNLASLGVVLNLPTSDTYSLQITNTTFANFTIRYGGPTSIISLEGDTDSITSGKEEINPEDHESMLWLHCCAGLKYLRTGTPLLPGDEHGVWTCSEEQVIKALEMDFASVDDFMLIKGVCVWEKDEGAGGIQGQVMNGNLDVISSDRIDGAWTILRRQIFLKEESFFYNIRLADQAWLQAADEDVDNKGNGNPTTGISGGQRIPKEPQRTIFDSVVTIQELADRARSTWMKIHLL